MPAAVHIDSDEGGDMVNVMIGIDPHKASHTAAAIDPAENELGHLRVGAAAGQVERLLVWAEAWPERPGRSRTPAGWVTCCLSSCWRPVSGCNVPPKLATRVRLLATGDINKNDPNDARSVAVAALRSPAVKPVAAEDHQAVMKLWANCHRDLGRARTQLVCRLQAGLLELVPGGGVSKELSVGKANKVLAGLEVEAAVASARYQLAEAFIDDLARIDEQIRDTKERITAAVIASNTTVTEIFGVGPVVAAMVKGDVGDVLRFASHDHFASYNGTAPIEVSSGSKKIYRPSRRG